MAEYVDFHYMPLEGKITGKQVLKQTEDAINDIGEKVYSLNIDSSLIDEALETSEIALNTAESALSAVTTGRSMWFNNVAEMIESASEIGVVAETKGYYLVNDGGGAVYIIRQKTGGDVVDGGAIIQLDDENMVAQLVTDGEVNVKQFGAMGNGVDDDSTAFQNTSTYAQTNGFTAFIALGTYNVTETITGTFNSFGEVTIVGGGTVDIVNLHDVVDDVTAIKEEVESSTESAQASATSAATSATNAENSATSASTTLSQLIAYLDTKEEITAPIVDPTLTINGAAADAQVTGDNLYGNTYNKAISLGTLVADEWVDNSGGFSSATGWKRTGFIAVDDAVKIYGSNGSCYIATYKTANNSDFVHKVTLPTTGYTFADNEKYFAITGGNANINPLQVTADCKTRFSIIENKVTNIETKLADQKTELKGFDHAPLKPLICETKARCLWQCATTPSVFENCVEDGWNGNAWFSVSGTAGDTFVTVGSGGNANMSDISAETTWWSAVISTDGVHYKTCLAYYIDDTTLGVYPAVEEDFVNGVVGALWRTDNMHLTKRGYIAFAQAMFSQNPKHCEKGSLIAQFIAGDTVPFTTIGGTMYVSTESVNPWQQTCRYWYATQQKVYSKRNTGASATTGKRGVSWSVNANGKKGYVEVLIAGTPSVNPNIPLGNEIYIDLYADNVLVGSYVKTTNILEDVCLDFDESQNLVLEIYQLNQAASQGNGSGFRLSSIQVFENQNNYGTDLIKSGTVIGQMFDSWGVHQNEATAKEFSRLINEKTGVTVPYTNHSLGSQTSAWGKAWFYENVWKYNPSVAIIDFCINDINSMSTSGFPSTVAGPDGTLYDNLISLDDYIANMNILTNEARSNGIQLIIMPPHRSYNGTWYTRLCAEIE